jgi:hypothetical protein
MYAGFWQRLRAFLWDYLIILGYIAVTDAHFMVGPRTGMDVLEPRFNRKYLAY